MNLVASELSKSPLASKTESVADEERNDLLTGLQDIKLSPEQIEVVRNAYASVPDFNRFAGMMYREGLWTASFTREEIARNKLLLSLPHKTASVPH